MSSSIRISSEVIEKLAAIKAANNLKSYDEVISNLLPKAVKEDFSFQKEEPAFTLVGTTTMQHCSDDVVEVSYSDLKESKTGDYWLAEANSSTQRATVLFKDDDGGFIRFDSKNTNALSSYCGEIDTHVEYFHFL